MRKVHMNTHDGEYVKLTISPFTVHIRFPENMPIAEKFMYTDLISDMEDLVPETFNHMLRGSFLCEDQIRMGYKDNKYLDFSFMHWNEIGDKIYVCGYNQ